MSIKDRLTTTHRLLSDAQDLVVLVGVDGVLEEDEDVNQVA